MAVTRSDSIPPEQHVSRYDVPVTHWTQGHVIVERRRLQYSNPRIITAERGDPVRLQTHIMDAVMTKSMQVQSSPSILRDALLRALAASFLSLLLAMTRAARFKAAARCSSAFGTIGIAWNAPVLLTSLSCVASAPCRTLTWLLCVACAEEAVALVQTLLGAAGLFLALGRAPVCLNC